ncbi:putative signal transducing protein [Fodinibius sediminis]|uniref:Signal transducing protein n=1 Tax=Fodinibius sediminis TaxID=1214077 RepID=A0A521F491_9BACT|nr:DUF2007 domain-containing protein [Fodinibius sediminis]SMO91028.1 Putative signal transducing protein [Fodinibius sediminis]
MFDGPKPNEIEDWVCVLERSTEYEVEFAKNYLSNMEIPSNILSKRDSSFSVNVGEIALVYLYVPKEYEQEARKALEEIEIPSDVNEEEE